MKIEIMLRLFELQSHLDLLAAENALHSGIVSIDSIIVEDEGARESRVAVNVKLTKALRKAKSEDWDGEVFYLFDCTPHSLAEIEMFCLGVRAWIKEYPQRLSNFTNDSNGDNG